MQRYGDENNLRILDRVLSGHGAGARDNHLGEERDVFRWFGTGDVDVESGGQCCAGGHGADAPHSECGHDFETLLRRPRRCRTCRS